MAGASDRCERKLSRIGSDSRWAYRAFGLASLVFMLAVMASACGDDAGLGPPQSEAGSGGAWPDGGSGTGFPCTEGAERDCHITISEHNGVLTCYDGVQQCVAGAWGPCGDGSVSERMAPSGSAAGAPGGDSYPKPLSLSDAGPCVDNPCDPTCQNYDENPDGGIAPDAPPASSPWNVGDINALPDSIYQQGTNEPCTIGEDCQFDQYCNNPARGACSHDPCASGIALFDTCNPCVEEICANDPTCCKPVYGGNCSHDVCANGTALKKSCDACATAICNARPGCCIEQCTVGAECPSGTCNASNKCTCTTIADCPAGSQTCTAGACTSFWSAATCASQVGPLCGATCPFAGNWTAACAARVETDCAATCRTDPPCAHDKCYTGTRLSAACDPCVSAICGVDPLCCSGPGSAWTQSCVDKVATVCNQACPPRGNCISWEPGQTNPLCAGVDLTVGVACGTTVPVCNRGMAAAPAGVTITSFPVGAGQLPDCTPAGGTVACTTAAPIPPGECISVSGCVGLADGMELMVNAPGGSAIAECHCENNWSIYSSATCQSPDCTGSSNVSLIKKVSMYIMFDRSLSMGGAALPNRWTPATKALKSFFQDPGSAGLGVALRFWPQDLPGAPCTDPVCQPAGGGGCVTPLVPLGTLTADAAPMDAQENALVNAVNATPPAGGTPMSMALDGAETWAINRKMAFPEEEVVVLFVTDGLPTDCDTTNLGIIGLASNAYQNFGIRTHAIGIADANATQVDQIAQAGGGASFFMLEGATVEQNLLAAMLAIRGDAIPCDLSVPTSGSGPVQVVHVDSMGMSMPLAEVASAAACGAGQGWYYHPTDPTLLKLCPATCTLVRNDPGAEILVSSACAPPAMPLTYTQTYHGPCGPGKKVQWGAFTYDTTTPGDSNVQFSVRTADTEAGLTASTYYPLVTAQLTPDTQVCETPGPPICSVDLYTALDELPDAARDYLELRMILNPTVSGTQVPTVHSWDITYSCPDTE
jgi:hypothetical protein